MRVTPGAGFERVSHREFRLDPEGRSDYRQLIETLRDSETNARADRVPVEYGGRKHAGVFMACSSLSRALAAVAQSGPLEIVAVSRGLYDVTGNEPLQPDAALVLGPCKVIPQERPHIRCRSIDLATDNDAATLMAELTSGSSEPAVAYRGGHRWVQGFEKLAAGSDPKRTRSARWRNLPHNRRPR